MPIRYAADKQASWSHGDLHVEEQEQLNFMHHNRFSKYPLPRGGGGGRRAVVKNKSLWLQYSFSFFFFLRHSISGRRKQLVTCVGVVGDYSLDEDIYLKRFRLALEHAKPVLPPIRKKTMEMLVHNQLF